MFRTTLTRLAACCAGFALLISSGRAAEEPKLSKAAQGQADALQSEKQGRTAAQQKLDSQLVFKVKKHRGEHLGGGLAALEARVEVAKDGFELVDIHGDVTDALLAELKRIDARVVASVPKFKSVRAWVPLASVEALAA